MPGGDHPGGAGAVLQHPRPAEIHEERQRGGRRRQRRAPADRPQPPGGVHPLYPGRQGGAAHAGGRQAALRRLRRPGPGLRPGPDAGGRQRRGRFRPWICHPAPGGPGHQGHADVFLLRPDHPLPDAHRRPGGGLRQPAHEGQIPRLRPPHRPAPSAGGRERPPGEDGGEIRRRAGGVLRRPPRGQGRPGQGGAAVSAAQARLRRRQSQGGLLPDDGREDVPGKGRRAHAAFRREKGGAGAEQAGGAPRRGHSRAGCPGKGYSCTRRLSRPDCPPANSDRL